MPISRDFENPSITLIYNEINTEVFRSPARESITSEVFRSQARESITSIFPTWNAHLKLRNFSPSRVRVVRSSRLSPDHTEPLLSAEDFELVDATRNVMRTYVVEPYHQNHPEYELALERIEDELSTYQYDASAAQQYAHLKTLYQCYRLYSDYCMKKNLSLYCSPIDVATSMGDCVYPIRPPPVVSLRQLAEVELMSPTLFDQMILIKEPSTEFYFQHLPKIVEWDQDFILESKCSLYCVLPLHTVDQNIALLSYSLGSDLTRKVLGYVDGDLRQRKIGEFNFPNEMLAMMQTRPSPYVNYRVMAPRIVHDEISESDDDDFSLPSADSVVDVSLAQAIDRYMEEDDTYVPHGEYEFPIVRDYFERFVVDSNLFVASSSNMTSESSVEVVENESDITPIMIAMSRFCYAMLLNELVFATGNYYAVLSDYEPLYSYEPQGDPLESYIGFTPSEKSVRRWESISLNEKSNRRNKYKKRVSNNQISLRKDNEDLRRTVTKLQNKIKKLAVSSGRLKPHGLLDGFFESPIDWLSEACTADILNDPSNTIKGIKQYLIENIGQKIEHSPILNPDFERVTGVPLEDAAYESLKEAADEIFGDVSPSFDLSALFLKVGGYVLAASRASSLNDFILISTGVLSQHISPDHLAMISSVWKADVYEKQGDTFEQVRVALSSLRGTLASYEDVPLYRMAIQTCTLMVFAGFRPSNFVATDNFLQEMLTAVEDRIKSSPMDIMLLFLSLTETIIELFDTYTSGGSIKQVLLPTSVHERVATLMAQRESVFQGTYRGIYGKDPVEYENEVRKLLKEVNCELRRKDLNPRVRMVYENYATKLIKTQQDMDAKRITCRMREAPCTLMIVGGSNIGKTTIADLVRKAFGHKFGIDVSDSRVYFMSDRDKFDSNYRQDVTVIIIDDMSNIKPDNMQPVDMTVARTIDVINNVIKYSVQPEAADKGKIQFRPELVVGTTNVPHLNAGFVSCEPMSIWRRWIFMDARIKREYSVDDRGLELDGNRVPKNPGKIQPPMHLVRLYKYESQEGRPSKKYFRGDEQFRCISSEIPYLMEIYEEEREKQRNFVRAVVESENVPLCVQCGRFDDPLWCSCDRQRAERSPVRAAVDPEGVNAETEQVSVFLRARDDYLREAEHGFVTCRKWYTYLSRGSMDRRGVLSDYGSFERRSIITAIETTFLEIESMEQSSYAQRLASGEAMPPWDLYRARMDDHKRRKLEEPIFDPEGLVLDYLSNQLALCIVDFALKLPTLFSSSPRLDYVCFKLCRMTLGTFGLFYNQNRGQIVMRVLFTYVFLLHFHYIYNETDNLATFGFWLHICCFFLHSCLRNLADKFYSFLFIILPIFWWIELIIRFLSIRGFYALVCFPLCFFYYNGITAFAQLAMVHEINNARKYADIRLVKSMYATAGLLSSIAVLRQCWTSWKTLNPEGNLSPKNLDDVAERHAEKNDWLPVQLTRFVAPRNVVTMALTDVLERLKTNTVRFVAHSGGKDVATGVGQMVKSNIMMIPQHTWDKICLKPNLIMTISRKPGFLSSNCSNVQIEGNYRIPGYDFVLLKISKMISVQDLADLLPTMVDPINRAAVILLRRENEFVPVEVMHQPSSVNIGVHEGWGGKYIMPGDMQTQRGDCMSPVVSKSNPHIILGFHCGGRGQSAACFNLNKTDLENALAHFDVLEMQGRSEDPGIIAKSPLVTFEKIDDLDVYTGQPALNMEEEIHERAVVNFVKVETTDQVLPGCDVLGYAKQFRVTPRSEVMVTKLSEYLERAGWPREHGAPVFQSDRQHAKYFQLGVRGMKDIDPSLLITCAEDYVVELLKVWNTLEYPGCQPLTVHYALNGVPGNRWIKQLDEDTSSGFGMKGKKSVHMYIEYMEPDGRKRFTLKPEVEAKVFDIMEKLRKGVLCAPVVVTALKDEPTKLTDLSKVRVFAVFPFAFFLAGKMLFAPLLAALYDIPLSCEMMQGTNVTTSDWTQLREYLVGFSPLLLEGDFSKFDVHLNGQIIRMVGSILARIADFLGYSKEDVRAVYTYVADVATNPWVYNGSVIMMDKWNPSGNYLTIAINGIANCLLHRMAFYEITRNPSIRFRDYVHLATVGDDSAGSTKLRDYNMVNISEVFARYNLVYTDASKSDDIKPFQNADDLTLCKRRFRWEPLVQQYVAPLSLSSIGKMLHCRRKSILDEDTLMHGNVLVALRELARHDPDTFDTYAVKLRNALDSCGKLHMVPEAEYGRKYWWDKLALDYPLLHEPVLTSISEDENEPYEAQGWVWLHPQMFFLLNTALFVSGYHDTLLVYGVKGFYNEFQTIENGCTDPKSHSNNPWITDRIITTNSNTVVGQIVGLEDAAPQWVSSVNNEIDESLKQGVSHIPNDEFFKRPVKVFDMTWNPLTINTVSFDPWVAFCQDPRVANRMAFYKYFRGKLRVKAIVNGNPFYYGRLVVSYIPLPKDDHRTHVSSNLASLCQATQRQHFVVDACNSQGGEMLVPWIYPRNAVNITGSNYGYSLLGMVVVDTMVPLSHANNLSTPIKVEFFAYMDQVEMLSPTTVKNDNLIPQGCCQSQEEDDVELCGVICSVCLDPQGEYGMISGPASTIANWTGKLSMTPFIGKYARATEIASSAVGKIAALFGFSRPRELVYHPIYKRTTPDGAVANVPSLARSLALDAKKEVTVDPRVVGSDPVDSMAIVPLAMKGAFLTSVSWNQDQAYNTALFQGYVSPLQGFTEETWTQLLPSAYVSVPFVYWSGSMNFRVQVVASKFHRGRLRLSWDPTSFATGTEDRQLNTVYNQIIDISEECDVTFNIGWGQNTNYLRIHNGPSDPPEIPSFSVGSPITPLPPSPHANGIFQISVVTPLTSVAPSSNPVYIVISPSMCSDFQVAQCGQRGPLRITEIESTLDPVYSATTGDANRTAPAVQTTKEPPLVLPPPKNIVFKSTIVPNAVVYGRKLTNSDVEVLSPEFSTALGSTITQIGKQLWREGTFPYEVFVQTNSSTTGNIDFIFENAVGVATSISLAFSNGVFTGNLPASIGSTVTISVPLIQGAGNRYIPFSGTVTGSRVVLSGITLPLEDTTEYKTISGYGWNFNRNTGTYSLVDNNMNFQDNVCFKIPNHWIDGTTLHAVSRYSLEMGSGGNQCFYRTINPGPSDNGMAMGGWNPFRKYSTGTSSPGVVFRNIPDASGNVREIVRMFYLYNSTLSETPPRLIPADTYIPQGDVMEEDAGSGDINCPEECPPDFFLGMGCQNEGINGIYFGEQIGSLRLLFKRYMSYGSISAAYGAAFFNVPTFDPGHLDQTLGTGFVYAIRNLHQFLASAFITARGGGRYLIISPNGTASNGFCNVTMNPGDVSYPGINSAITSVADEVMTKKLAAYSPSGSVVEFLGLSGSVEVEVPYYSHMRFFPVRSIVPYDFGRNSKPHATVRFYKATTASPPSANTFMLNWSAAEDFSLDHFLCVPRIKWLNPSEIPPLHT